MNIKRLKIYGVNRIEILENTNEWYWGSDYTNGDLYEAMELFNGHNEIKCNRLIFVHYPEGRIVEPILPKYGQYFGKPIFFDGEIHILLVDFKKSLIHIFKYNDKISKVTLLDSVILTKTEHCYNMNLHQSPLMLTTHKIGDHFNVLWPEKLEFKIGSNESFCVRDDYKMYFSRWSENPDYKEEIVIRKYSTGEILDCFYGYLQEMPNGHIWIIC